MKTMYIKAEIEEDVLPAVEANLDKLPEKIGLLTTAQHISQFDDIKKFLEEKGKAVFVGDSKKTTYPGQILGCDFEAAKKIADKVDSFLYIGTGRFHPLGIVMYTGKKVLAANPLTKEIREFDKKDTEKIEKRKKGALVKFYSAENIGIIVSTKPGQNRMKDALELKRDFKKKGKNAYIFITDTLDFSEIENFPFVDCYVNTMCPRIGLDDTIRIAKPIINIDDLDFVTN